MGLRALAMGAMHPDIAALEKYILGVVPTNLEDASKMVQKRSEITKVDAYFICKTNVGIL